MREALYTVQGRRLCSTPSTMIAAGSLSSLQSLSSWKSQSLTVPLPHGHTGGHRHLEWAPHSAMRFLPKLGSLVLSVQF